jgi:FdhE protein
VTAAFLRKLLGGGQPVSPEVTAALRELARLAEEQPTLAGPCGLLAEVLPALYDPPPTEAPPPISPSAAAAKRAEGVPLLRGETLALDESAFRRRWAAVCAALGRQGQDAGPLARAGRGGLAPCELLADVLAGRPAAVHARAEALGLDPALTATVLRLTLFPVLSAVSAALGPAPAGWGRGYCPVCGSWPLLGEFRGLEQVRVLRCGLCAAGWEYPRLGCPYCGTRDHERLGFLHVEGEESQRRAATCAECRGYVKMVATLTPLSAPGLLAADAATLHLDLAAAVRGYAPGA